jgi:hypothetical protein
MTYFRPHRGGALARFSDAESGVLREAVTQLLELLGARTVAEPANPDPFAGLMPSAEEKHTPDDPALARLFPDAYRDDPAAAAEIRRLTEDTLREGKVARLQQMYAVLPAEGGKVMLDPAGVDTWLRGLTDLRLVLGERLAITEDVDLEAVIAAAAQADDTATAYSAVLYAYASELSESLVHALSAGSP